MGSRRPRVGLHITPRLLQDTLSLALSPHADVVDLKVWLAARDGVDDADSESFDLALVSRGSPPVPVRAEIVLDVGSAGSGVSAPAEATSAVPSLEAIQELLLSITAAEA